MADVFSLDKLSIKKLKALAAKKEAGEITEEEFTAAKAKLLS